MNARERDVLLHTLEARFEQHKHRHEGIAWRAVHSKLKANPAALRSLAGMETTGGEPDVIGRSPDSRHFIFCDCSTESPSGRRSTCYDGVAKVFTYHNGVQSYYAARGFRASISV